MTTEKKAQNFKRKYIDTNILSSDGEIAQAFFDIFPELRESEDEIIRNRLINLIRELASATVPIMTGGYFIDGQDKRYIAYLEKQKEPKVIFDVDKFFVGKDVTDFKKELFLVIRGSRELRPTDEEIWLNIENQIAHNLINILQEEQKPAEWSEEDEKTIYDACCWLCKYAGSLIHKNYKKSSMLYEIARKLRSLRPQPQAELTLLDKEIIKAAVAFVEQNDHFNYWGGIDKRTVIKALRSLKPSWKPSEEQMDSLRDTIVQTKGFSYSMFLPELYEQLKKL